MPVWINKALSGGEIRKQIGYQGMQKMSNGRFLELARLGEE